MAAQDDRPEPEEMTYLFRNCDHEYVGNFANRPGNTESIQGPEPFQRYILEREYLSSVRFHRIVSSPKFPKWVLGLRVTSAFELTRYDGLLMDVY
ncbi:hypothetical protein WAI453_005811 [Rhynchosporium graminicola]